MPTKNSDVLAQAARQVARRKFAQESAFAFTIEWWDRGREIEKAEDAFEHIAGCVGANQAEYKEAKRIGSDCLQTLRAQANK